MFSSRGGCVGTGWADRPSSPNTPSGGISTPSGCGNTWAALHGNFFFNCLLQLDCQIYVGRGFPCFSILFTAVCSLTKNGTCRRCSDTLQVV